MPAMPEQAVSRNMQQCEMHVLCVRSMHAWQVVERLNTVYRENVFFVIFVYIYRKAPDAVGGTNIEHHAHT